MSTLDVAVVVPLEDPRGDIVDHLRSWTDRQTLARERYQVLPGLDGEYPELEQRLREILQPRDELVTVPGASLMKLYDAAARAASAEVLVLTEAHCYAEPECLAAVAELFASRPEVDGARFRHFQEAHGDFGQLSERWFDRSEALWERYDWTRIKIGGSAVRAEAYARAGGIDPEMDLFAPFFLGARLNEQGLVEELPEAVITHVLEDTMGEDLSHTTRYAHGECVARAKHDSEFMNRYFGPGGLWDRRLAYRPEASRPLFSALLSAARRSPRDAGWLARELMAQLPTRVAGPRPRRAWERALTRVHGKLTDSRLVPFERRWQSYISASDHAVRATQLTDGREENGWPPAATGRLGPEELDGVLVGGYDVERQDGQAFCWTEPAALLRVSPPADGGTLRLDTAGLRGPPLDYLQGAYVAGQPLQRELICGDEHALEVRLPAELARASRDSGVVLVSRPLRPAKDGSSDRRRLGMPIVELELGAP